MALAVLLRDPEENPVALSDRPFRTGPAEEGGGAPGRGCQPPPPLTEGLVLLRGEPTATPLRSLRGIFLQPTSGRLSRASLKGLGRGEKNNNWRGGGKKRLSWQLYLWQGRLRGKGSGPHGGGEGLSYGGGGADRRRAPGSEPGLTAPNSRSGEQGAAGRAGPALPNGPRPSATRRAGAGPALLTLPRSFRRGARPGSPHRSALPLLSGFFP